MRATIKAPVKPPTVKPPPTPEVREIPGIPRRADENAADYTARAGRLQTNLRSGIAALDVVRTDNVDLVLSDWNMPGMTGIELLESPRAEGWTGLFGFITSESGQSTRTRAFEAGATFLVTKPFTGDSQEYVFIARRPLSSPMA